MGDRVIMDYFRYEHLPDRLQPISKMFHDLAKEMGELKFTDGVEMTYAFRKLLEAKDCAVRSMIEE